MKKFLALVLALVMTMSLVTVGASAKTDFTDDAKIKNAEAVEVLNAMGVLTGYPDGTFRPEGVLTRGAGAKIIAYLMLGQAKADKLAATYTVFEDVTDSVGLAAYIEWAAANGIVDGYGDGNFGPYNKLTEYAFGKMLLTALGYSSAKEGYTGAGWQKNVYGDAIACGIFDGTETWGACTRDTAARMALGALLAKVVVYGGAEVNGTYYWNGYKLNIANKVVVDGVYATDKALYTFYDGLVYDAVAEDIFDRPGHAWAYGSFSKFYMDAPVAEYKTAVTGCQILVDLGVAKTNPATKVCDYKSVNGAKNPTDFDLNHKSCSHVYGGQGVLTQVFVKEGKLMITEISTYLAQVKESRPAAHKLNGDETLLTVWVNDGDNTVNAVGLMVEGVALTKGDYVLINWSVDEADLSEEYRVAGDYVAYYNRDYKGYVNLVKTPDTFEGQKTSVNTKAGTMTIAGKDYYSADEYELGNPAAFDTDYIWFLDQYGNVIGTKSPADAAPKYGRIDAMDWVNDTFLSESAQANLVLADATTPNIVTLRKWTHDSITNTLTGVTGEANFWNGEVSDVAAYNETFFENVGWYEQRLNNNYGVVSYVEVAGGKLDVTTVGEVTAPYMGRVNNQQVTLGFGRETGAAYRADLDTQFLVYLGEKLGYQAYTGLNAIPTMTGVKDLVCVDDDADGYAEFVFVYADGAVFAGTTVEAFVFSSESVKNSSTTYEYTVWVGDQETTITSADGALFGDDFRAGLYHISFNAASEAISVEKCGLVDGCYDYGYGFIAGNGTVNYVNMTLATVYSVNWAEEKIEASSADKIGTGDYFIAKEKAGLTTSTYVAETVYIYWDHVDTDMNGHKPLGQ